MNIERHGVPQDDLTADLSPPCDLPVAEPFQIEVNVYGVDTEPDSRYGNRTTLATLKVPVSTSDAWLIFMRAVEHATGSPSAVNPFVMGKQ